MEPCRLPGCTDGRQDRGELVSGGRRPINHLEDGLGAIDSATDCASEIQSGAFSAAGSLGCTGAAFAPVGGAVRTGRAICVRGRPSIFSIRSCCSRGISGVTGFHIHDSGESTVTPCGSTSCPPSSTSRHRAAHMDGMGRPEVVPPLRARGVRLTSPSRETRYQGEAEVDSALEAEGLRLSESNLRLRRAARDRIW
jgi:hypothetical protein